jgi:hypothetical protein
LLFVGERRLSHIEDGCGSWRSSESTNALGRRCTPNERLV